MRSNIVSAIKLLSIEKYLLWTTLFFYIFLLLINPSNKIIVAAFFGLLLLFLLKIKSISLSLLFVYIASLVVFTGKTYQFQIIPAGIFPLEIFPQGYFTSMVVTPSHIISFVMGVFLFRQLFLQKINKSSLKLNLPDILLLVFFTLKMLSAVFGSKEPSLSLPSEILSLRGLLLYFYVKFLIKPDANFWKYLVFLLSGLIIFESILAFAQFANKSPLYKSLEFQVNIEYFGKSIDETEFTFRPVGTFDHANALGIWLALLLVFTFGFLRKNSSSLLWLGFWMGLFALITTISRSGWLGMTAGLTFLIYFLKKRSGISINFLIDRILALRFIIIPIFILLLLFFVVPRIENSFYSFGSDGGAFLFRKAQIQDSIEIIKMHPIFGVGAMMSVHEGVSLNLNTFALRIALATHNWFIFTALENGLPAMFAFIFFVLLSIRRLWYQSSKISSITLSVISSIICIFVATLFQPYGNNDYIFLLLSASSSMLL